MPNRRVSFDILANDKVSATYDKIAVSTEKLKARMDAIMKRAVNVQVDVNDKDAQAKVLDIQARLASLGKKVSSPRIDVAGLARAEAELAVLDHKLDEIGRKKPTPKMGVILGGKENNRILDEILNGIGALLPTAIPVFKALEGAAGGMATAFAGAAGGLGAFAAIAVPDLKTLSTNTTKLTQLQTKIKNLKAQGPSSSVVRAQSALNSALAAQGRVQSSTSSSSLSLAKAQLQLSHAQQVASSSSQGSTSSSTTLAKAQLRLQQAQSKLYNATPKTRATALYNEQQAELSLSGAQQSAAKSATTAAKSQSSSSYSVQRAELSVASAKASAAKSAQSSANAQAAAADRVKKAQQNLALAVKDSPVNKALLQQKQLLAAMTPEERDAATQLQKFQAAWKKTQHDFEPLIFSDAATGLKLARQGIQLIIPMAKNAGLALGGLEKSASKALNSQYYQEFFSWLAGRAGRDVTAFGGILGNLAKGASGLLRAFDPLANDMESGLEKLSGKFAKFGANAQGSQSFQKFINYVETEGPKVIQTFVDWGKAFADITHDLAPLAGVELKIVDATGKMIDTVAKGDPKLVTFAGGLYVVSRAMKALNVGQIVKATGAFAKGVAGAEAGAGVADGAVGKFMGRGAKFGKLLGGIGGAFGLTGLAATGMGGAVLVAAGAVAYLGFKMLTAKSANDKYYDSLLAQYGATGNNEGAFKKAAAAAAKLGDPKLSKAIQLSAQNAGNYGLSQAEVSTMQGNATKSQQENTSANKKAIDTYKTLVKNGNAVAKVTGLTRTQSEALAWSVGVDLKQKVGTSDKAQQAWQKTLAKVRNAQIANRDALLGSVNPAQRVSAATEILGDKSATAAEKMQAVTAELDDQTTAADNATTASAQFGDTLSQLPGDFAKNTTAAQANSAAHKILSGDVALAGTHTRQLAETLGQASTQYRQMATNTFNSTLADKGQVAAAAAVTSQHTKMVKSLEKSLEKMGISASAAHELAEKYLAIPKNITTSAKFNQKTAAQAADDLKKKLDALKGNYKVDVNGVITDSSGKVVSWTGGQAIAGPQNVAHHGGAATGGLMRGPGTRTSDSIPINVSDGEYVVNARSTSKNLGLLQAINSGAPGFANGGLVSIDTPTWNIDSRLTAAMATTLAAKMIPVAQQLAGSVASSAAGGTGDMSAHSASAAAAQAYARSILSQFGWSAGQMSPLISLWNGESGWNNLAQNPTSSAFGIAQFLNGTWAGKRFPKTTNYKMQVFDGMQYIQGGYGTPAAAFAAWSSRSPHWYGKGLQGGIFTKPTLIGVGENGAERVDVTPMKGYASGGLVSTGRGYAAQLNSFVTVSTSDADIAKYTQGLIDKINRHFKGAQASFLVDYVRKAEANALGKQSKLQDSFGGRLITSITDTFKDPHSVASIDEAFRNIIGRLDQGLKGSQRSSVVANAQHINEQMDRLASARSKIAARLAAANDLSTTVQQGAQSYADITGLTAGTPRYIEIQLRNKLASISKFAANIATLQKRGLSRNLLEQLIAAGIDQAAPIAEDLVHATGSQLHSLNATERAITRSTTKLGTVAVNAQFGSSAAHSFVAGLQRQEGSLERQMAQLAKVFAKSIGHTFHLKGYAGGGTIQAGQMALVGENGPEILAPGVTSTVIPMSKGGGNSVVAGPSADAIGQAVAHYMSTVELDISTRGTRTIATLATRGQLRDKRLAVAR